MTTAPSFPDSVAGLLEQARSAGGGLESLEAPPATRAELAHESSAIAATLCLRGVSSGDRVAIVSPNDATMVTAFFGIVSCASCAPLNPAYGRAEFDFYLDDLKPRLLVVYDALDTPAREAARVRGIECIELGRAPGLASGMVTLDGERPSTGAAAGQRLDEIALLLHTSGTTARPKLVPLTHRNLIHSARHIAATLSLGPEDRSLTVMPLFHIHGLVAGILAPLGAGGTVIVPPGFLAPSFATWLARFRPTWYTAVPTMHQAILERLSSADARAMRMQAPLRFVRSSSAAMTPQTIRDIEATLGVPVIESYGMTEASHQMSSNPLPPGERKPGSVGMAAGPEVGIMSASGVLLPPDEIGEVVIRGPNVTSGYLENPAANANAFTNGWFRTGDQGCIGADGYLTLTGRLKELINRAGEKVAPLEVDAVLAEHPAVAQALTFGMPHALLGEDVAAAVVAKPGAYVTEGELRGFVAERLAFFKVPRQIRIVAKLPVGATGKLQRRGMAERLGMVAEIPVISGDTTAARNAVEEIVAAVWSEILRVAVPGVHENFFALGGDSMLATRTVAQLGALLHVEMPLLAFFDAPTVAGVARTLEPLLAGDGANA